MAERVAFAEGVRGVAAARAKAEFVRTCKMLAAFSKFSMVQRAFSGFGNLLNRCEHFAGAVVRQTIQKFWSYAGPFF